LVFDAPAEVGLTRVKGRGTQDRFEKEKIEFFERVRKVYLDRAKNNERRYNIIDATQRLTKVQEEVFNITKQLIEQHGIH
jgi:dTMP kinase